MPIRPRRLVSLALATASMALGGRAAAAQSSGPDPASEERWYDRVSLNGYAQVRYNRLLENNERLVCTQCDRSLGANGGIFLRRARVSIVAQVTDRVLLVLQPDFTAESGEASGIAQVRDAYAELALDSARAFRVRLGQTNVPFGFENLVSSSKRLPFDRVDAINSAAPTERDLGIYLHWTPRAARARYERLTEDEDADKGTGDAGVVSLGAYNGQTANRPEENDHLHTTLRLAYPFALGDQVLEVVANGYTGRYVVTDAQRSDGLRGDTPDEFDDWRVGGALVLHPRPVGLQAEWNVGRGPQADPAAATIRERRLSGGYVQAMVRTRLAGRQLTPYVRAQRYDGAKKFELDARAHRVRELEAGAEFRAAKAVELTAAFMVAERTTSDLARPDDRQRGHRLRLQAQITF